MVDPLFGLGLALVSFAVVTGALLIGYSVWLWILHGLDEMKAEWRDESISERLRRQTRIGTTERIAPDAWRQRH